MGPTHCTRQQPELKTGGKDGSSLTSKNKRRVKLQHVQVRGAGLKA